MAYRTEKALLTLARTATQFVTSLGLTFSDMEEFLIKAHMSGAHEGGYHTYDGGPPPFLPDGWSVQFLAANNSVMIYSRGAIRLKRVYSESVGSTTITRTFSWERSTDNGVNYISDRRCIWTLARPASPAEAWYMGAQWYD